MPEHDRAPSGADYTTDALTRYIGGAFRADCLGNERDPSEDEIPAIEEVAQLVMREKLSDPHTAGSTDDPRPTIAAKALRWSVDHPTRARSTHKEEAAEFLKFLRELRQLWASTLVRVRLGAADEDELLVAVARELVFIETLLDQAEQQSDTTLAHAWRRMIHHTYRAEVGKLERHLDPEFCRGFHAELAHLRACDPLASGGRIRMSSARPLRSARRRREGRTRSASRAGPSDPDGPAKGAHHLASIGGPA